MEILSSLQNSEDTFNESLIDLRVIEKFEDNKLIRVEQKQKSNWIGEKSMLKNIILK